MIKVINELFIDFLVAFGMDAETFVHSSHFGDFELAVMETVDYDALETEAYQTWVTELCENF